MPMLYWVSDMSNGLIVQKYGGSSLSTPDRIRKVAERIAARSREGHRVVVAVSAKGSSTDELLKLAYEITPNPPHPQLDMLLTVVERISMALLYMAHNSKGCRAIVRKSKSGSMVTLSRSIGVRSGSTGIHASFVWADNPPIVRDRDKN